MKHTGKATKISACECWDLDDAFEAYLKQTAGDEALTQYRSLRAAWACCEALLDVPDHRLTPSALTMIRDNRRLMAKAARWLSQHTPKPPTKRE